MSFFSRARRTRMAVGLLTALVTISLPQHGAATYHGEQLRSPCADIFSSEPKPSYEIVDLHDRMALAGRDLKSLKHSQMVMLSADAFQDDQLKRALRENSALLCLKSESPATELLNRTVKRTQPLLVAIPGEFDGVRHLYSLTVDAAAAQPIVDQMQRVRTSLAPLNDRIRYFSDARPPKPHRDEFLDTFRSAHDWAVITVVCHNEGGTIKFPDGTTAELSEISAIAEPKHVLPLILSCNTLDHIDANYDGLVSTKALDFEDIAAGLRETENLFQDGNCHYLGDYLYALDSGLKGATQSRKRLGIAIIVIGGVAFAVCVLLLLNDKNQPTPTPSQT